MHIGDTRSEDTMNGFFMDMDRSVGTLFSPVSLSPPLKALSILGYCNVMYAPPCLPLLQCKLQRFTSFYSNMMYVMLTIICYPIICTGAVQQCGHVCRESEGGQAPGQWF